VPGPDPPAVLVIPVICVPYPTGLLATFRLHAG